MIKRKYFLSVKVAHNDNTGNYSWWNTIINTKGWTQSGDDMLISAREFSVEELQPKLTRRICEQDIEVLALNRI
tara:strand:- start:99 stop:320 length:222 start_codon:yes stop_codon:yes gene_type:complete